MSPERLAGVIAGPLLQLFGRWPGMRARPLHRLLPGRRSRGSADATSRLFPPRPRPTPDDYRAVLPPHGRLGGRASRITRREWGAIPRETGTLEI
jgi:hypothetical protein